MRPSRSPAARRARAAFARTDRPIRVHARVRPWMAPFDELEALVPRRGRVLDYGCGSGLFTIQMALAAPERQLHGVDLSPYKVAQARIAAADLGDRVEFEAVEPGWEPAEGAYDVVVMCDVLYLQDRAAIERTIGAAAAALRPGGVLVVKEITAAPRWKHRVAATQELLSVRVLRWTRGSSFNLLPLEGIDAVLAPDWDLQAVPLDRGYPYSHLALVARRGAPCS